MAGNIMKKRKGMEKGMSKPMKKGMKKSTMKKGSYHK